MERGGRAISLGGLSTVKMKLKDKTKRQVGISAWHFYVIDVSKVYNQAAQYSDYSA